MEVLTTDEFIRVYKPFYVKSYFNNDALYNNCIYEANDVKKIDKLMTIKTLNNFWDNVRKFTKNVYSNHSISRWQWLAEHRAIQLDLQQNYKHLLEA